MNPPSYEYCHETSTMFYFPPSLFFFLPRFAPVDVYVPVLVFFLASSASQGNTTLSYFTARSKHHNRRATPDNVAIRSATWIGGINRGGQSGGVGG